MTLPRVTVYNEVTVDGKIEGFSGDGERYYRRGFGLDYDAIMMGSTTAQALGPAEPEDELSGPGPSVEPVPPPPGFETLVRARRPTLVVVDGSGTVRNWRHAQAQPWYDGFVSLVGDHTPREHVDHLHRRGVAVVAAGSRRVDLPAALEQLRRRHGITSIRTDTGGHLTGALLAADLVDELVLLVAPKLSARHRARSLVELPHGLPRSVDLDLTDLERLDDGTLWLRYEVRRR